MAVVSVLMSVYNEPEDVLRQSIESILKQTFSDFEFVIIGDNPDNDRINDIVTNYEKRDKRISFLINSENIGLTKSLNRGLKLCHGKYIARMDADDIAVSTRLQKQLDYLESHADVHILNTAIMKFFNADVNNNIIMTVPSDNESIIERLFISNLLFHPTVMFRKSFIDEHHIIYNEKFRRSQDYAMWLEIASNGGKFSSLQEPLLYYRASENQISIKYRDQQKYDADAILLFYIKRTLHSFLGDIDSISPKTLIRLFAKEIHKDATPYNKELLYKLLLSYDNIFTLFSLLLDSNIRQINISRKKICKIILSCFINRWENEKISLADIRLHQ